MKKFKITDYKISRPKSFNLKSRKTMIPLYYEDNKDYKDILEDLKEENFDLQNKLYAHDRFSLLLIFQAMDAAGKDSTIKHVFSGMNPIGVKVSSFKKPSDRELDHDFLWRTTRKLPRRGEIGIFNRSYYEEVLIVKVRNEILRKYQKLPKDLTKNLNSVWKSRYKSIRDYEDHLQRNGTIVLKFFLNISKEEQKERFLRRINIPSKNWKFSSTDIEERKLWPKYMKAYEDMIKATSTPHAPWFVIPADDKKNIRLMVAKIVNTYLKKLPMNYPRLPQDEKAKLLASKKLLLSEK